MHIAIGNALSALTMINSHKEKKEFYLFPLGKW